MPVPPEELPDPSLESERIYAQALVDLGQGESLDLTALCRAHPAHADELRRVHALWQRVSSELRGMEPAATLAQRLKQRFGADADPGVSLQGEAAPASDFSSEVMTRLSGRAGSSSRYKLEGEVARGGMGAILRVWDEDLRRHLAMKVVLGMGEPPAGGRTPEVPVGTLARFLEEAQVTGQLDHPGIVPVHELGLDAEGRVYFTMKLVKGVTLKTVFEELAAGKGGWTQARVLAVILRVCEAMAYAHDKGVIHRDLKPANVMVGRFGEVYVMDWGLAKILEREDGRDLRVRAEPPPATGELRSDRKDHAGALPDSPLYTMDGDVVGTPAYMSPEQAAGRVSAMGPQSDVYALGAMLYHLLAGHMPYVPDGARANNYAVWQRVQEGPPRALHEVAPRVPAELAAICEKAMAREASARYANTSELAADLAAYVEGRVVRAYETGPWAEARKWIKRNRQLAGALAAAALAVVIGAIGFAFKADQAARAATLAKEEAKRADAKAQEAQENLALAKSNEVEAQAQRGAAERSAVLAQEQQRLAEAQTAQILRLSDLRVLAELEGEAHELWPPYPAQIPALESWIESARALLANLPGHRATLAEMRTKAHPWTKEDRVRDRAGHPRAAELAERQSELDALIAQLDRGLTGLARERADARVAELEPEVVALTEEVSSRRTWRFATHEEDWQHGLLAELIGNLEALETGLLAEDATTPDRGWSLPKRLAFARDLDAGFRADGEYARAWTQALPAIGAAYPGLKLTPQMGLIPIGPDPASGLWEFAHLMTGAPARRDADGKLVLTEHSGVVLVLLRAGTFWMGAQRTDPIGRNYDPQANFDEGPVHEVELSAFFLSKFEMTQGQWLRVTGRNPSYEPLRDPRPKVMHPVEQVSWLDCTVWLPRAGLALPSEAQWEYGARGGTATIWWTGSERESLRLQHAANLADQAAARAGATWGDINDWPELDDGHAGTAPVGTYSANAFGLHEITGNVWEWCQDGNDVDFYATSPRMDPVANWEGFPSRAARGGGFFFSAVGARSAFRDYYAPALEGYFLGVRPIRFVAD